MKPHSHFVDHDAARAAVALALPSIEKLLQCPGVSACHVLHLVVLDPGRPHGSCPFDEAVLYEHSVGPRAHWDADYAQFARDKARLCWRHRMGGRQLVLMEPHRLAHDDSLLWGGVWLDGLVVAASGALSSWDEACSLMVAAHLRAIALDRSTGMEIAGVLAVKS